MVRSQVALIAVLGCVISFLAGRESSRSYQVANAHQSEFRHTSLSLKSVPVCDFPEKINGGFSGSYLSLQCRRQHCGGNEEINRLTRRDWRIPFWCVRISKGFWRCGESNVDSFNHVMAAFISGSLSGIFYFEPDNENACFVSGPHGGDGMHVRTELPLGGLLHISGRAIGGIGTVLGDSDSSHHPIRLDTHSNKLASAYDNQGSREPYDPPIGRRFVLGLFGCVGGYSLGLWSLGLRDSWLRRCLLGVGSLGVLFGLLGWWITFSFPCTWNWPL